LIVGESCVNHVYVQQSGADEMARNRLGIVPHFNFRCNVRITRISVRLLPDNTGKGYPYIQVWRPSSKDSTTYAKIAQVHVAKNHITRLTYVEANILLTGINTILIESGDVIGYYHPPDTSYKVRTIQTAGYELYVFDDIDGFTATSIDLNNKLHKLDVRQPLISFKYGKYMCYLRFIFCVVVIFICYQCYY